jgi:hypothetical protein
VRVSAPLPDRRPKPTRHESDQRLAAWAAEWAAPTGNTGAGPIDTAARADTSRAQTASGKSEALEPAVPDIPAAPEPSVRVLSGPNLGGLFLSTKMSWGAPAQVAVCKVGTASAGAVEARAATAHQRHARGTWQHGLCIRAHIRGGGAVELSLTS